MLIKCMDHKPRGIKYDYIAAVDPAGFPQDSAVCWGEGCKKDGLVFLTTEEFHKYIQDGQRIFQASSQFNNSKARVKDPSQNVVQEPLPITRGDSAISDDEMKRMIKTYLQEISNHNTKEQISQGLLVASFDFKEYSKKHDVHDRIKLGNLLDETLEGQPDWVIDNLEGTDLPDGFAQAASRGDIEIIDFDDPRIDHEWVLEPGSDLLEKLEVEIRPYICGDRSVQSLKNKAGDELDVAKEIIIVLAGSATEMSVVPVACILAAYISSKGLDNFCASS